MKTKLFMGALVIASFFAGCKGDTGPQGPTGNANVTVSNVTITPSDWTSDGSGGWDASIGASGYDPTATAISIYWSTDNTNFYAVPYIGYTEGAPDINYSLNSNSITMLYDPQSGAGSIGQPVGNIYFNVVVVPQAQLAKMKNEHINMNDYKQVQAYINSSANSK